MPLRDGDHHTFTAPEWRAGVPTAVGFVGLEGVAPGSVGIVLAALRTANAALSDAGDLSLPPQQIANGTLAATRPVPREASRMSVLGVVATAGFPRVDTITAFVRADVPIGTEVAGAVPPIPTSRGWNAQRRQLSWAFMTDGPSDAVDVVLEFGDDTDAFEELARWTLRLPPGTTEAVLPAIPPELDLPHFARPLFSYQVVANDYLSTADYDAARQLGEGGGSLLSFVNGLVLPTSHDGAFSLFAVPAVLDF